MILLYGAGGEPGRGEIPMNTVQHTVTQVDVYKRQTLGIDDESLDGPR